MDKLIELMKKLPIDLGQKSDKTFGKIIAVNLVPSAKNKNALDIGCREGIQSKQLEEKGYNVTGIDLLKDPANKRKVIIHNINNKLPFENETFDLIWCSEVIEHVIDPKKTVNEFRRVLKKGGKMILTTPNSYALIFRFANLFGFTPKVLQRNDHLWFFSIKDIKNTFPKAKIFGYFPYFLLKFKIQTFVGLLTPTFIIVENKK